MTTNVSPEVQAQIDAAVAAATEALADNNRKLTNELKNVRAKMRDGTIDPDEHQKALDKVEELTGEITKLTKKYDADTGKLSKTLTEKEGALHNLVIDGGLTESLVKAGVKPELMNAAKAMLRGKTVIKAENGTFTAVMGDKPISDAIKDWAGTDEGKHFVVAPSNSGGNAGGSNKGAGTATPSKRSGMNYEQKASFIKEHGQEAYLNLPQ